MEGDYDFGTNGQGGTARGDPTGTAVPSEPWNNLADGQPQRQNPFGSAGGGIGTVHQPGGINGVPVQSSQNIEGWSSGHDNSPDRFLNLWFPVPVITGNPVQNCDANSLDNNIYSDITSWIPVPATDKTAENSWKYGRIKCFA
jgi:hypothetical protein